MCEPRVEVRAGDKVRETDDYHRYCQDREVRGEVISIRHDLAVVRNIHGWETCLHKSWLEKDYDTTPSHLIPGLFKTTWSKKKPSIFKATKQNYCQHCGEKL